MKNKKIIIIAVVVIVIIAIVGGIMGAKAASEKRTQELYANINKQIEKTENLETNYFADEYDLSAINKAKEFAQKTISNSDKDNYKSAFENLQKENDKLNSFIKEKEADIYNVETGEDESYPFMIKEEDINKRIELYYEADFCPVIKQSSKFPTSVSLRESETTDTLPIAWFWRTNVKSDIYVSDVDDCDCTYQFNKISTKKISVKTDSETVPALVNTEIIFKYTNRYGNVEYNFLDNRNGYLCKNKDNEIILLLQDYDNNEDYYVPYKLETY